MKLFAENEGAPQLSSPQLERVGELENSRDLDLPVLRPAEILFRPE
jgi:hypothetical protein